MLKLIQYKQMNSIQSIPIRCIRVEPTHRFIEAEVFEYFGRFGVVNSVDMGSEDDTQYCLVTFNELEAASKVLSKAAHRIADCDVEAKVAEPWQQPDHILNKLNDDCLRKCLEYLELVDLANAANVCHRFRRCARNVFSPKYKKFEMNTEPDLLFFKSIMVNFGPVIQSLEVKFPDRISLHTESPICLINRNTHANLQKLEFYQFDFFENLKHLDTFVSLKHLAMHFRWIYNNSLHDLLSLCPKLEYLHIEVWKVFPSDFPQLMRSIGEDLQHLVEFHLKIDKDALEYIHHISNAKCLKKLKIRTDSQIACWTAAPLMKGFVENHVPIEHLDLACLSVDDETIRSISQLEQIKIIELEHCVNLKNDHLILLRKELPQLQRFSLLGDN